MGPAALLEVWQHQCLQNTSSWVVPDRCRDLIAVERAGEPAHWFISSLPDTVYRVESAAGTVFTGYRFRPGVRIDVHKLLSQLQAVDPAETPLALT